MPDNIDKSQREIQIFCNFITRSGLQIDPRSVEKRHPREPDILCRLNKTDFVAFELVEICSETIAEINNRLLKQTDTNSEYIRPEDPVWRILKNKRSKTYQTPHPIELLVYAGRTFTPPDQIISKIKQIFYRPSLYRRVWFMGWPGEPCECVIE